MQRSQRNGLIVLALLCMATMAAVVIRSRNAAKESGYDDPHPTEFTVLETEPPLPSRTVTGKTVNGESDKKGAKRESGKRKGGSKNSRNGGADSTGGSERQWLDDL